MSVVVTGDSKFGQPTYIVAHSIALGATHTTIQAAINAASAGDTIAIKASATPYIEDLTHKPNVNIVGYVADGRDLNVNIQGNNTFTSAGFYAISGVSLNNTGAAIITCTGSANILVQIDQCTIVGADSTVISINNVNATFGFSVCSIGTSTNHKIFDIPACKVIFVNDCGVTGAIGVSSATSTIAAGVLEIQFGSFQTPITSSGTASVYAFKVQFGSSGAFNLTWLTIGGSGGLNRADHCSFYSGTASAISVSGGSSYSVFECIIDSGNVDAITGAGTIVGASTCTYTNTSSLVNTTTITPSFLGIANTFTPAVAFGGSSTGITYTTQTGFYTLIGKICFFEINITLSSKGAQVGAATITGLPFLSGPSILLSVTAVLQGLITLTANYTDVFLEIGGGSATGALLEGGSGQVIAPVTDAMFANTSTIQLSGWYRTA